MKNSFFVLLFLLTTLIVHGQSIPYKIEADTVRIQTRSGADVILDVKGIIRNKTIALGSSADSIVVIANGIFKKIPKIRFNNLGGKPIYFPTNYDSSGSIKDSLAIKLKYTDTASLLNGYLRKSDTIRYSTIFNTKLNIADTANMLLPYLRKADTLQYNAALNSKLNLRDSNQYITPTAQATAINSVRLNGITTPYEGYLNSSTGWTIDQDGYFSGMASLANIAYSAGDANNATRAQKNQNNRRLAVSVNGNYASDSGNVVIGKNDISGLQPALDSNLKKADTTGIRAQLRAGSNISITGSYPTLTITAAAQTTDTISLSNRINTKLNTADTASMLSAYGNGINARVKYIDTANMLNGYLRKSDTIRYATILNTKLNITDTTNMLTGYLRKADTLQYATVINAKLNIADTTNIRPRLTAGTNITSITGTYPNLTINAANQTTDISGKADKTTTVNGYPLSSNVTIGKNNISGLQTALDSNLKKTNNLSDLASASTARSNLGLGSFALRNSIDTTDISSFYLKVRAAQNSAGATPAGSNGQFQYNNAGVFAGSSNIANASGRILIGNPADDGVYGCQIEPSLRLNNSLKFTATNPVIEFANGKFTVNQFGLTGINAVSINGLASGSNSIAIGSGATASNTSSIAIGLNSIASGSYSLAIGGGSTSVGQSSIAVGIASRATNNEFVAGYAYDGGISNVYFGSGSAMYSGTSQVIGAAISYTINGSGAYGTNYAGGNITIAGGKATGSATPGDVIFSTSNATASGSTLQSLSQRWFVKGNTGALSNTSSPASNQVINVASLTQTAHPYPSMTYAQRLAITMTSANYGDHVYQTDGTEGVYIYKSSGWVFAY